MSGAVPYEVNLDIDAAVIGDDCLARFGARLHPVGAAA